MRRLDTRQADFSARLEELTAWQEELDQSVNQTVTEVLAEIARRGDVALLEYTARFDRLQAESVAELEVSRERQLAALEGIELAHRQALAPRPIGLASIGSCRSHLLNSWTRPPAVAYRRDGSFSRHFSTIVSRSRGTLLLSLRGLGGSS